MTDSLLDPNSTPQTKEDLKDYYQELVGENKKFKTNEDLAKAKWKSDEYIRDLEKQKDELRTDMLRFREEAMAKANLQELIDRYDQARQNSQEQPPQRTEDTQRQPTFDPKAIEEMVTQKLQEVEATRTAKQNLDSVKAKLTEEFGANYQATLQNQINTLGLTPAFVDDLASRSPSALYKLLGIGAQQQTKDNFLSPPQSVQRTDSFSPSGSNKRTWKFYQEMKRSNPTLYYDPKTSVQIHNDRIALGDAFKDGDYSVYGD